MAVFVFVPIPPIVAPPPAVRRLLVGLVPLVAGPLSVVFVTPINSNTLRVFLTREPKHISAMAADDALNRLNWQISLTSGPGGPPVVEGVENPQAQPAVIAGNPDAWSIDLRTDRRVLLASVYLVVASGAIAAADRSVLMSPAPDDRGSANGDMRARSRPRESSVAVTPGIDILYETFAGIWGMNSAGDLAIHGALSALKKRIIRRLLSSPGGFYHLPTYGVGLRVKELRRTTNLRDIERNIREQILQESEVRAVQVVVTTPSVGSGVLVVQIDVQTVEGLPLGINLEIPEYGQVVIN